MINRFHLILNGMFPTMLNNLMPVRHKTNLNMLRRNNRRVKRAKGLNLNLLGIPNRHIGALYNNINLYNRVIVFG